MHQAENFKTWQCKWTSGEWVRNSHQQASGKKVTAFVTFLIENSNFWNLISINENRPFKKHVAI